MITWITPNLGTAAHDSVAEEADVRIVDVRDMVDKPGNLPDVAKEKVTEALEHLNMGRRVVICCDYGISRSNAVAVGVLAKLTNLPFNDAVRKVMQMTGEKAIKIEVLSAVREAIEARDMFLGRLTEKTTKCILVTGGTGFIGSALLPRLQACHEVIAPGHDEIDLLSGAINLDLLAKEHDVRCIVHLANPRIYTSNEALGVSLILLKNVLDVCLENHLKLIYLSGWEVYHGYREQTLLAPESLPLCPKGTYGETKYLCEVLLNQHQLQYGLECALLRVSPVYGVGTDKPKFLHNFIGKALRGEDIVAHKYLNGFPRLDLLHIDDLVRAILITIEHEFTGSVNIGMGKSISTTEVAQLIVKILGSSGRIRHREIEDFAPNIVMDIARAKAVLGWYPQIEFEEGLRELLKSLSTYGIGDCKGKGIS